MELPTRAQSQLLLEQYIKNPALRHHCEMVASAMQAYAQKYSQDLELWYQTGLLHDLDYEQFPDQHPLKAVNALLTEYPQALRRAVLAHGPEITGVEPDSLMERYLFACDEISGFLHAYSLMRPNGFEGMKAGKVLKKLTDLNFAAKINRQDIERGFSLIEETPSDHVQFLIKIFSSN